MPAGDSTSHLDMLNWIEPTVRDRISAFWNAEKRDADVMRPISDLHWRMWRDALSGRSHLAAASRRDLARLVRAAALPAPMIERGDEMVIDEIAEVIAIHFRRSSHLAKQCTKMLVAAAAGLATAAAKAEIPRERAA